MKHIESISSLIEALGGNAELSRKLELKHASNVSEWKRRQAIPVQYWKQIIQMTVSDDAVETVTCEKLVDFHCPEAA